MEKPQRYLDTINNNDLFWINVQNPTREDIKALGERYPFHQLNLDDCLSKIQLPRIDKYDDHLFIIFHFPTKNKKESDIPRVGQLSIFLGRNYLVTVHHGELESVADMFESCKNSDTQRLTLMGRSTGYLLYKLIDTLVDELLHVLMKVVGNLDDIEDAVFDGKTSETHTISFLRREITTLRRMVFPLKRIVSEISKEILRFSREDLTAYFSDIEDHIDKVLETLDESKEAIEIYKDTNFTLSSEKSNQILAVLTILFTITIPATIVSSFYGMNIAMPGRIETPLTFFGPYTTMILIIVISIGSALIMLWYFHRAGWIGYF